MMTMTTQIHGILFNVQWDKFEPHSSFFIPCLDDKKAKIGITRENKLININFPHPELNKYKQQEDESFIGYIIRKIHRKLFTVGLLNLPRLLPELSIFSIAFKK